MYTSLYKLIKKGEERGQGWRKQQRKVKQGRKETKIEKDRQTEREREKQTQQKKKKSERFKKKQGQKEKKNTILKEMQVNILIIFFR